MAATEPLYNSSRASRYVFPLLQPRAVLRVYICDVSWQPTSYCRSENDAFVFALGMPRIPSGTIEPTIPLGGFSRKTDLRDWVEVYVSLFSRRDVNYCARSGALTIAAEGTSREKNNIFSITTAIPQKVKIDIESYSSGQFYRFSTNPEPFGA